MASEDPQTLTLKKPKDKRTASQSQCMGIISSFPIIQEAPKRGKACSSEATLNARRQKSSELKFKIESVGTQLEEDDDLDMCPARTRSSWPQQIVPWWKPSHPREKPPYSYATLIAHAILSSKDGRLTLSDIYKWISEHYPYYVLGQHGWQNSIRHNLSLNKKWFLKLDRRPTQANPGKGCYWTLIAGMEQIFIDNLTQAGGHSRKHHDIGLTAELSMGQHRRGSFGPPQQSSAAALDSAPDMVITRPEDYASNTSTSAKKPVKMSPLYTTFRMSCNVSTSKQNKRENGSLHKKRQSKKQKQQATEHNEDSDCDSGVDVGNEYVEPNNKKSLPSQESDQWAALLDMPWSVDDWVLPVAVATANNTDPLAFPQQATQADNSCGNNNNNNNNLLDHTMMLPWDDCEFSWQPQDAFQGQVYPTLLASSYDPPDQLQEIQNTEEQVQDCLKELLKFQQQQQEQQQVHQQDQQQQLQHSNTVTIDLNDEEVTQKYLHFDDDSNDCSYADDEDEEEETLVSQQQQQPLPQVSVHHDFDDFPLDTPSSILKQHHEFASMRELLYSKI